MGYKKSFNLVTLQLIIPLSTMTKAEYKNAYGIDLDDIDIERVTLLQEDGSKEKYYVDEIKTTENGIDIYAGGKILSIGSSVSVINNAYSVDNAKPIYWHSVSFTRGGDGSSYARAFGQVIILNNSKTPIDVTAFTNLLKIQGFFAFVYNGEYDSNEGSDFTNMSYKLVGLTYLSATQFALHVRDKTTNAYSTTTLDIGGLSVTDLGVNKIN